MKKTEKEGACLIEHAIKTEHNRESSNVVVLLAKIESFSEGVCWFEVCGSRLSWWLSHTSEWGNVMGKCEII